MIPSRLRKQLQKYVPSNVRQRRAEVKPQISIWVQGIRFLGDSADLFVKGRVAFFEGKGKWYLSEDEAGFVITTRPTKHGKVMCRQVYNRALAITLMRSLNISGVTRFDLHELETEAGLFEIKSIKD
jgi:hypothetical protein